LRYFYLSFSLQPRHPSTRLIPYTTLFRSHLAVGVEVVAVRIGRPCRERVTDGGGILHDRGERRLETVHICLRANRDAQMGGHARDRKSTRLNSSHVATSYAVFCLNKK